MIPDPMIGSLLRPLNQLKALSPEVYESHASKYVGRDWLREQRVPFLDCLWNDVLHFAPIHPCKIKDALVSLGFRWRPARWFEFDAEAIGLTSKTTVVWSYPPGHSGVQLKADDVNRFAVGSFRQMSDLPDATLAYYQEAKAASRRPLLFAYVPHVLHLGVVDPSGTRTIEV